MRQLPVCLFHFFLLLSALSVCGQKKLQFDSLYQPLPNYHGNACFVYYVDKSDGIIKDGEFRFSSQAHDSTCATTIIYLEWDGNYRDNQKHDEWLYLKRVHKADIEALSYDEAEYTISSRTEELSGRYEKGRPEGKWSFQLSESVDGKLLSKPQRIKVNFTDGLMDGKIYYFRHGKTAEDTLVFLSGEAQNGLMIGDWAFRYTENGRRVSETRSYLKGVLRRLVRVVAEDTTEVSFPIAAPLETALTTEGTNLSIVGRPLSLTFNDGYPRSSPQILSQQSGNRIIEQVVDYFTHFDPQMIAEHGLVLGTNRGYYPLSSEEKKSIKLWHEYKKELVHRLDSLQARRLEFFQYRADSTLRFIAAWEERQREVLDYTAPWEEVFARNELVFYDRQGLLVTYADSLLGSDQLTVPTPVTIPYTQPEARNFVTFIAQNIRLRQQMADSLSRRFDQRIEVIKLREKILVEQLKIDAEKLHLDSLYADTLQDLHLDALRDTLRVQFLGAGFDRLYREFLDAHPTPEQQQDLVEVLQIHLTHLRKSHELLHQVARRDSVLDTTYTDYSFDPFTFNDKVPERVKRSLYEAVVLELIPMMLHRALQDKEVFRIRQRLQRIGKLQETLFFLRNKDTKSLERKLRRTEALDEKLSLIENF